MQQQHKNQTAYSKQAEMDEAIDRVNNFINCLNIKKNRKEELKRIVDLIQISYHKALVSIMYLNFQTYLNTPTKTTTDSDVNRPLRVLIIKRHKNIDTIIDGKIESGCCRVGDRCLIMPNRTCVEVTNIYYEDIETDSCDCGKNVRLKLNNIEEEISPGFILCNVQQDPCRVGRVFDAQIAIIEHQSIIYPGYSAVLHIHAAITTVQLKQIIRLIDHETGNTIQEHPTFIKQGQIVIARFELLQSGEAICMETFKDYPQLGRFTLCNARQTVALGNVLEIIE
ncbi:unnamed protein product [Rotaria sp. Silwood1]|nr:unnamed protein product [Rotaria sp. Silwood1]